MTEIDNFSVNFCLKSSPVTGGDEFSEEKGQMCRSAQHMDLSEEIGIMSRVWFSAAFGIQWDLDGNMILTLVPWFKRSFLIARKNCSEIRMIKAKSGDCCHDF
jgi:hypothetical protein